MQRFAEESGQRQGRAVLGERFGLTWGVELFGILRLRSE
jgi:hypothetical protein